MKLVEDQKIIGAVQVNTPFTWHNASYECAAWWEDSEALVGVHPVYLGRSYHHPKNLTMTAHIAAKVVDDYFPALWAGNPIGNKPYEPKHVGESRTIRKQLDVVTAIESTGNSPGNALDYFIHPSWWSLFLKEAETELTEAYKRLPKVWEDWRQEVDNPLSEDYRWKVGMVAHFGKELEKWARRIEKITWHTSIRQQETFKKLYDKNTQWSLEIPEGDLPHLPV